MRNKTHLSVTPGAWVLAAVMLLILPLNWLLAAAGAAFFHELCHYCALRLCGVPVFQVQISGSGAKMDAAPMTLRQEFFCALAGPLGGLALLLFLGRMPRVAICAGAQSLFNLLPVYPLDGGRALGCIIRHFWPGKAALLLKWTARICLCGILFLGLLAAFRYHLGLLPLLLAFAVCIRAKNEKLLANRRS